MLLASKGILPELKSLLLGDEDYIFLIEVALRSVIMFVVVVTGLRLMGKRGIKQLSVFELVVILTLGSAAGDPMFYKEVGLLSCTLVFLVMLLLYKAVTYLIAKSKKVEILLEGSPICLIRDGRFSIGDFEKEDLATDEFFSELRVQNVAHLGQIEQAFLETSGEVSVFFYEDEDVRFGLPILPDVYAGRMKIIPYEGVYACTFCGFTEEKTPTGAESPCPICERATWVTAISKRRIS